MCPMIIGSTAVLCFILILELLMCASLISLARAGADLSDLTLRWDSYAHQLPLQAAPVRLVITAADLEAIWRAYEAFPMPHSGGPRACLRAGRTRPRCGRARE